MSKFTTPASSLQLVACLWSLEVFSFIGGEIDRPEPLLPKATLILSKTLRIAMPNYSSLKLAKLR